MEYVEHLYPIWVNKGKISPTPMGLNKGNKWEFCQSMWMYGELGNNWWFQEEWGLHRDTVGISMGYRGMIFLISLGSNPCRWDIVPIIKTKNNVLTTCGYSGTYMGLCCLENSQEHLFTCEFWGPILDMLEEAAWRNPTNYDIFQPDSYVSCACLCPYFTS